MIPGVVFDEESARRIADVTREAERSPARVEPSSALGRPITARAGAVIVHAAFDTTANMWPGRMVYRSGASWVNIGSGAQDCWLIARPGDSPIIDEAYPTVVVGKHTDNLAMFVIAAGVSDSNSCCQPTDPGVPTCSSYTPLPWEDHYCSLYSTQSWYDTYAVFAFKIVCTGQLPKPPYTYFGFEARCNAGAGLKYRAFYVKDGAIAWGPFDTTDWNTLYYWAKTIPPVWPGSVPSVSTIHTAICDCCRKWHETDIGRQLGTNPSCDLCCGSGGGGGGGGGTIPPPGGGGPPPPGGGNKQTCLQKCEAACEAAYGKEDPRYYYCVNSCFQSCNSGRAPLTTYGEDIQVSPDQILTDAGNTGALLYRAADGSFTVVSSVAEGVVTFNSSNIPTVVSPVANKVLGWNGSGVIGAQTVSGGGGMTTIRATTDETASSTTLVDHTELKFTMDASSHYRVRLRVQYEVPGGFGVGFRYRVTGPTATTVNRTMIAQATPATAPAFAAPMTAYDTADKQLSGIATGVGTIIEDMFITNGGGSGDWQFKFAQDSTDGANPVKVLTGSTVEYQKL